MSQRTKDPSGTNLEVQNCDIVGRKARSNSRFLLVPRNFEDVSFPFVAFDCAALLNIPNVQLPRQGTTSEVIP